MKKLNVKMLAVAVLITLFVLSGCAGKDDMGADEMKKETLVAEMKTDSGMKKMDSMADDMSDKNMNTEMAKKMPEQMESTTTDKMDSMKTEMDESMESEMQKKQ